MRITIRILALIILWMLIRESIEAIQERELFKAHNKSQRRWALEEATVQIWPEE